MNQEQLEQAERNTALATSLSREDQEDAYLTLFTSYRSGVESGDKALERLYRKKLRVARRFFTKIEPREFRELEYKYMERRAKISFFLDLTIHRIELKPGNLSPASA